ncbi:YopX family protein [Mammaliicoccus sciuri]|uniref:YopX family protein n=1 Tax=Mammaliicoccus sciuri TaxID=1296 RepID=UPI0020BDA8D2|nr:YopX family protein [Mammaliicoccus sciuri]
MLLKFRAWDKVAEDIFKPEVLELDKYGKVTGIFSKGTMFSIEDFELLQSTGLLDKNGTEIFEGDIIDKGYSNIDIVDRIGYVKFGTGDDSDGYLNQEWLGWTTNNDDSLLDVHEHCTVLGNKFEHPHLLGED